MKEDWAEMMCKKKDKMHEDIKANEMAHCFQHYYPKYANRSLYNFKPLTEIKEETIVTCTPRYPLYFDMDRAWNELGKLKLTRCEGELTETGLVIQVGEPVYKTVHIPEFDEIKMKTIEYEGRVRCLPKSKKLLF